MDDSAPLRLSARGITKTYGSFTALQDVDLELRAGEIMALLGENGAGKSTMVKVLSGLVIADSGELHIDGEVAVINSVTSSQRAGIAVVQQEYSTVPTMSVADNLFLGQGGVSWMRRPRRLQKEAREILGRVGLEHLDPRTEVGDLSVAQMQLLEIARVLARDARIIIFDEPTAALADAEVGRVLDAAKRLAAEGRSIIYVTHRLGEVFEIADRVTIFRDGRSESSGAVADLDVDTVVSKMIGRKLGHLYPHRSDDLGEVVLRGDGFVAPGLKAPVDFTVREGEILGLTGQIGSGASAVLEALAGLRPVLSGHVSMNGVPVNTRSRRAGIRQGIAYCSADRKRNGIFATSSIRNNLSSPWLSSISRVGFIQFSTEAAKANTLAIDFAMDRGGLERSMGSLSGGNQQKVAVGKWAGIRPKVLLIEEPTRGVDVGARADIYATLRRLASTGVAIIVCSSDTNEVLGLSDTVMTFFRGIPTACRPAADWTEHDLVREVLHREEVTA